MGDFGRCNAAIGLNPACGNQRTPSLVRIHIDEADMDPGEGLAAFHADGIAKHPLAVGQVTAVPAGEGAGDLDILDGILIAVAQREGDERL